MGSAFKRKDPSSQERGVANSSCFLYLVCKSRERESSVKVTGGKLDEDVKKAGKEEGVNNMRTRKENVKKEKKDEEFDRRENVTR